MTTQTQSYFDFSRLRQPWFYINLVAGPVLVLSMFLPWFDTSGVGRVHGHAGTFDSWQTFGVLNYYLLWCGVGSITVAPWIAARRDRLSWTPGELSIFFALMGFGWIVFNCFISPPGSPPAEVHVQVGVVIALLSLVAITVAAALRARSHTDPVPPGTI